MALLLMFMILIAADNLSVKQGYVPVFNNLSFTIKKGEQWAVTGPSGSGKTTLLHLLSGKKFFSGMLQVQPGAKVVLVEQQHRFKNLSNTSSFYYQQRFNSFDADDAINVWNYLQPFIISNHHKVISEEHQNILSLLKIDAIYNRNLIQLSNGENKRLQIAKALLGKPDILLLDNPFLGLDVAARNLLHEILAALVHKNIHIILVTTPHHIPAFITHVLALQSGASASVFKVRSYWKTIEKTMISAPVLATDLLMQLSSVQNNSEFTYAVQMKQVNVQYGDKTVLKDVCWNIRKGERWALSGPNGAGKSTLLSLISGDNPQAYANEIYLFDKRRGSGESIWDIKKKIGYVSPELHLYFETSITTFDVVASGLFDTIGLFRQLTETQIKKVAGWLELFQLKQVSNRLLSSLPASEQRLVLLARALVKNPPLLILDEPAQGLDEVQAVFFKNIVEQVCSVSNKTLIYVSHFSEEIPSCVHHFIELDNGSVTTVRSDEMS